MAELVLCTLNAKFLHASLGLRYLFANLGKLEGRAALREFDVNQPALEVVEALLAEAPTLIGFGVYVWNVDETLAVVRLLRAVAPAVVIVLGGPEVSHETEGQPLVALADHVIRGEADLAFAALCRQRLASEVPAKVLDAPLPDVGALALPWDAYSDEDLANRLLYVEASRGCPYRCEFCLSSLDEEVRPLPPERFFAAMERLLARGARSFKFIDRTFNLDVKQSLRILEFFHARLSPGLFLHFELVPDRLPAPLREVIRRFPEGALQFEVGVQTLNPEVEQRISRRQDHAKLEDNLRFLREQTHVHLHVDLIVGLPGEDRASFARGFDALVKLRPHEIQVGLLKRLKGTPLARREVTHGLVFSPLPPFEVLRTAVLSFDEVNALRRFARTWDTFGNSGHFASTLRRVLDAAPSAFGVVWQLSGWLRQQGVAGTGVALTRRFRLLFTFLTEQLGWDRAEAARSLFEDYQRAGKTDRPSWLASLPDAALAEAVRVDFAARQARHRGA
ncbi:MAG: DUF4080 domain-containing protein [Myxococcus sp.]|nr:DUF4080 domain-containing protein [Myxococcus sp.]